MGSRFGGDAIGSCSRSMGAFDGRGAVCAMEFFFFVFVELLITSAHLRREGSASELALVFSNREFVRPVIPLMQRSLERRDVDMRRRAEDVGGVSDGESCGAVSSGRSSHRSAELVGDMCGDCAAEARIAMVHESRPQVSDEVILDGVVVDRWSTVNAEQLLSAAGPASALLGGVVSLPFLEDGDEFVNPRVFVWVRASVVHRREVPRLQQLWRRLPAGAHANDGDVVEFATLDPWQRFAHDPALGDATARPPLRLILVGIVGIGKTRAIRIIVGSERAVVVVIGVGPDRVSGSAMLCAPTGRASFHLKFGASTLRRVFGVPVGRFKRWTDVQHPRFVCLAEKLRYIFLFMMDEMSMIGR